MNVPEISIVLPAYNCESFLKEAIESILNQTFKDFELIIINDGSTDKTEDVIKSFSDPRIVYLKNEKNSGLVYTLNKGIDFAKGKYIARMDGDDIAFPYRLKQQVQYMNDHPSVKILATTIELINEKNEKTGCWIDDVRHTTPGSIRRFLPKNNCIAHPTVLIETALLQEYRYNNSQKLSEDYDLWLRLAGNGYEIHKLVEPQLLHRILQTSFTRTTGKNLFFKLARVKLRFVLQQIKQGRLNGFILQTLLFAIIDFLKGLGKKIKRNISRFNILCTSC